MPFTQLAAQRTHFKRLTRYIRLADYLIINAKLSLAMDATTKVKEAVEWVKSENASNQLKQGIKTQDCPLFRI